ncbi:MAG: DUF6789 family protein [Xanthobacteraceae bacterium]
MRKRWIWKALVAGLCGSVTHAALMFLKARMALLPSFQPYQSLQEGLSALVGSEVPAIVSWLLSFLSGATIVGFVFGLVYRLLPGKSGAMRGLSFGLLAWLLMGLLFFPVLHLGLFATGTELGLAPAIVSLAMLLTYGIVMGAVYAGLDH